MHFPMAKFPGHFHVRRCGCSKSQMMVVAHAAGEMRRSWPDRMMIMAARFGFKLAKARRGSEHRGMPVELDEHGDQTPLGLAIGSEARQELRMQGRLPS